MKKQEQKEQRKTQALEQIWEFMTQMYGNLWVDAFGEVAGENQAWKIGLTGLTAKQVMIGLEKTALNGKTFPPTLPEFLSYCKDSKFDFNVIFNTCVYWSSDIALEQKGLIKTREALFIMRKYGADIKNSSTQQAERIVRNAIDELEKYLADGNELPEFPIAEIDEFPQGEKIGFSLATFNELAEG